MVIFMHFFTISRSSLTLGLVLFLFAQIPATSGQTQNQPQDQDEVIRIRTELVQAGVTVLDKQGRFVDGLEREQFELRVDGKSQPISFFERVGAGSSSEEALLAAARGKSRPETENKQIRGDLPDRGRIFFFFVDDLHMQAESVLRARKTILQFLDKEMKQNDQVAVASSSEQIGFLQQLTDNKTVLRAAVERLKPLPLPPGDMQEPPMSEYLALAIQEKQDREVLALFMEPLLREFVPATTAETIVRGRADQILKQSFAYTRNTLAALGGFVRNVAPLSGRKVVFFLSDGFLLRSTDSTITDQMRRLTDAAARNGVVIYTADPRGLATDLSLDAGSRGVFDARGVVSRSTSGELSAMQEALRTIAEETGGRAMLNTNAINTAFSEAVKQTAAYYVLAWQPSGTEQKGKKFRRLEVSIKGRPDLSVLVQRGFLQTAGDEPPVAKSDGKAKPEKVKTPAEELRAAITAIYPTSSLPTYLTVNYVDTPKEGTVLSALMSIPYDELAFNSTEGKTDAAVDLEGYIYNDQGKSGSRFKERLKVSPVASDAQTVQQSRSVLFNHQVRLTPGLYQVRVAARDVQSGRVGSAIQWIEIPDLKSRRLTLSSLQLGQRPPSTQTKEVLGVENFIGQLSVGRRFTRDAHLRFLTFIYNAAPGAQGTGPDVVIQIQIFRNDQPVVTDELRKVPIEGQDYSRLAYGAEIPLNSLTIGRYALQVTVIDRIAKTSASQRVSFTVE